MRPLFQRRLWSSGQRWPRVRVRARAERPPVLTFVLCLHISLTSAVFVHQDLILNFPFPSLSLWKNKQTKPNSPRTPGVLGQLLTMRFTLPRSGLSGTGSPALHAPGRSTRVSAVGPPATAPESNTLFETREGLGKSKVQRGGVRTLCGRAPVLTKPHCCFCWVFLLFPPVPGQLLLSCGFTMHFAGVSFLVYSARIDMIVGPPPPSTPRHKKYPTKGPTAPPRESPQYSPRLGCQHLSDVSVEWPAPSLQAT